MNDFFQLIIQSWPWYVTRAAGLVALSALILLLISGITSVTGQLFRFMEPLQVWFNHRVLGYILGASVFIHVSVLSLDNYSAFSFSDIFIPFVSNYKTLNLFGYSLSLGVALGIIVFYLLAVIIFTSLFILQRQPKVWKLIHYLSYLVFIGIILHAWLIGTDMKTTLGLGFLLLALLSVAILAIIRWRRI